MVDEAVANPVATVERRVPERRPEHIATDHADTNPPTRESASLQFVAKFPQQHRDVLAEQIPPRVKIEFVMQDVDAVPRTEIHTHRFIETELITVVGRPRLRGERKEEPAERRCGNTQ